MKAIVYRGAGGREVIEYADVPEPVCGSDDAIVDVAYAGVNRADVLERQGVYGGGRKGDIVPGLEFSGVVREIGANVSHVAVGDRVCALVTSGAYADAVAVNAAVLSKVPSHVSLRTAAALPEAFITAYDALVNLARMRAGDNVLVHAAGSGVGLAAIGIAHAAGAYVVGTSRTQDKLERAREHGLDLELALDEKWTGRALAATNGRGFDAILDFVGGPMLVHNVAMLATGGRIVQIGTLGGGMAPNFHLGALMAKRGSLIGTMLRLRPLYEKVALARDFETRVLPMVERGELRATIDTVMRLERAADAHAHMEEDKNFGKILLEVAGAD